MAGYVPLPAYNPGGGVDFSPINNALSSYVDQKNKNALLNLQTRQADQADKRLAIDEGQFGIQKQNAAYQTVQRFGQAATAVDQMTDPVQRSAAWKSILARHGTNGLTPEELDPVTGPKLMAAQAGQFVDPRDSQAKDLALEKTRAEIGKLNVEAANGGGTYGKAPIVLQGPDGRFYAAQFGSHGEQKLTPLELPAPGQPAAAGTPSAANAPAVPPVALTPARGVGVAGDVVYDKATGNTVRNVGPNLSQGELAKGLGSEGAKYVMGKPREDAQAAVSTIHNMEEARKLLDSGIITGKGANLITSMKGWADTFGIAGKDSQELLRNTQAFSAEMGREVGNVIRAFGSGTGLSDADREYAQAIAGGNIELTADALRKITDINERLARAKIKTYNTMVSRIEKGLSPFPLEIEAPTVDGKAPAPSGGGAGSSAPKVFDWTPDGGLKKAQ